jgi:hypothetical protein
VGYFTFIFWGGASYVFRHVPTWPLPPTAYTERLHSLDGLLDERLGMRLTTGPQTAFEGQYQF